MYISAIRASLKRVLWVLKNESPAYYVIANYNDNMACINDAKILKDPEIWLSMIRKGKLDSEKGGREVQKLLKKFDLINGFPLMFWVSLLVFT